MFVKNIIFVMFVMFVMFSRRVRAVHEIENSSIAYHKTLNYVCDIGKPMKIK
jgi:hypothetical protein